MHYSSLSTRTEVFNRLSAKLFDWIIKLFYKIIKIYIYSKKYDIKLTSISM